MTAARDILVVRMDAVAYCEPVWNGRVARKMHTGDVAIALCSSREDFALVLAHGRPMWVFWSCLQHVNVCQLP